MKFSNIKIFLVLLLALTISSVAFSSEDNRSDLTSYSKDKVHLFLLAGQSNMAGRGVIDKDNNDPHPRIFALNKEGNWQPATDPIHFDKKAAGAGLARHFALALVEDDPNIVIGLIPAACGGSSISHWQPGAWFEPTQSHPYDDAISRTHIAMQSGTLKGILWHQGEADCKPGQAPEHKARLQELIKRFRTDLDAPDLPFIVGELGRFYAKDDPEYISLVNRALKEITGIVPFTAFVSCEDLTANPDQVHFNTASHKIFGARYARKYLEIIDRKAK
ncbi:MAG: sialate O-acetylesterase [Sedimentisphaerales bacterium]|nr:sialate O-acetylesterase [Sedimentisphaerales bacterium]MBN2844358.1 sialate O-acetylesterase [Sedimentisphaerales bacterium]